MLNYLPIIGLVYVLKIERIPAGAAKQELRENPPAPAVPVIEENYNYTAVGAQRKREEY